MLLDPSRKRECMLIALTVESLVIVIIVSLFISDRKKLIETHDKEMELEIKRGLDSLENASRKHQDELKSIRKFSDNIEAIALSFNDLNADKAGMIKIIRVDPSKLFEWNPNR